MTKIAEKRFVEMVKSHRWYRHKYGDVRYCQNCMAMLPKTENTPDYALGMRYTWVEAKNNNKTGRWPWYADIGPQGQRVNQRKWMGENNGFLFIVMKEGQPPDYEDAYLIPWYIWLEKIEPLLLETDQRTIIRTRSERSRIQPADELFQDYKLIWNNGHWDIGKDHIFWQLYYRTILYDMKVTEDNLSEDIQQEIIRIHNEQYANR